MKQDHYFIQVLAVCACNGAERITAHTCDL